MLENGFYNVVSIFILFQVWKKKKVSSVHKRTRLNLVSSEYHNLKNFLHAF